MKIPRTELEDALALANRILDKPYIDPDGDICLLARQLIRVCEGVRRALEDQIKYCSNGLQHVSADQLLEQLPLLPAPLEHSASPRGE